MGQLIELNSEQKLIEKIRTLFKENLSDTTEVSFESFCEALCNDSCSERLFEFLFKNYLRNMEGSRTSDFEPTLFHENLNYHASEATTLRTDRSHPNLPDHGELYGSGLPNLASLTDNFDVAPFRVYEYSDSRPPSQPSMIAHSDSFLRNSSPPSRDLDIGSILISNSGTNPTDSHPPISLSDRIRNRPQLERTHTRRYPPSDSHPPISLSDRIRNQPQLQRTHEMRSSPSSHRRGLTHSINRIRPPYAVPDRHRDNGDSLLSSVIHQPYVSFTLSSPYVTNPGHPQNQNVRQVPNPTNSQPNDSGRHL